MTVANDQLLSDAELMRDLATERRGDALRVLVDRHGPAVFAAAHRQADDIGLAEDVAQAAFIVLLRRAGSLRRPDLLPGWLMKVTRNCAQTARRSARRRATHEAAVPPAINPTPLPPDVVEQAELLSHLDRVLAGLPEVDRAVVTMAYLQSQAVEQIGISLGMKEPAVRKRLARAVEKLRRGFAKAGVTVSSSTMVVHLQRLPAPPPPENLSGAVMAAAQQGAGTSAGAIAVAVGRRAAWKLIAAAGTGFAVGTAIAATVVLVELKRPGSPSATGTSSRRPSEAGLQSGPADDVYHSDFAHDAIGWSARAIDHTPLAHIPYLGPFTSTSVRLPIVGLPPHRLLHVQAELFLMGSWDGTGHISGPWG